MTTGTTRQAATHNGHDVEAIKLLLEHKADPNRADTEGRTPLLEVKRALTPKTP